MLLRHWSFRLEIEVGSVSRPRAALNILDADGSELVEVQGSATALNDLTD